MTRTEFDTLIDSIASAIAKRLCEKGSQAIPSNSQRDSPLSDEQRQFMAEHYHFAYFWARFYARRWGKLGRLAEDVVENAAIDGLLIAARRSTKPGFIATNAKGLLRVIVRRQVRDKLLKHYGRASKTARPNGAKLRVHENTPDKSSGPATTVESREFENQFSSQIERVRSILGKFQDIQNADGSPREREILRAKARALGVKFPVCASTDELRELLAVHVRRLLSASKPQVEIPDRIRERAEPTPTKAVPKEGSAGRQLPRLTQAEAMRFVEAWQSSKSVRGAAKILGGNVRAVLNRANFLRKIGVRLKHLPISNGPTVRAVINMTPSLN